MKGFLWVVLGIAFVIGLIGVVQRLFLGHTLTGYGSYVVWGLWVSMYIYFIGLSAGAFLISSLIYVFGVKQLEKLGKLSLFIAVVTLPMALLSIVFDLGHMERFWFVFTRPHFSSMMAWMVWLYTAYFFLLLVETWVALRGDLVRIVLDGERKKDMGVLEKIQFGVAKLLTFGNTNLSDNAINKDNKLLKILGSIGIPLAIAFHGGVGALFAVVGARPYWHSALYPILFLTGALLSGGAAITAIVAVFWESGDEKRKLVTFLGKCVLGLLIFDLLLEFAEYSIPLWGGMAPHVQALKLVLFGEYAWVFWIVHLFFGTIIPLFYLIAEPKSIFRIGAASTLVASMYLAVRLNLVIPGLITPEVAGIQSAYVDHRLIFSYAPTFHEWLVSLWIISFGLIIFYLGWEILPLGQLKQKTSAILEGRS